MFEKPAAYLDNREKCYYYMTEKEAAVGQPPQAVEKASGFF